MRFLRYVVACVALSMPFATGAAARTFVDKTYGFAIDFADSWVVQPQYGPVRVVARSTESKFPGGHCSVVAIREDGLLSMTQAEIEAAARLPDSAAWWRSTVVKGQKNPRIEAIGVGRHPTGHGTQYAIYAATSVNSRGKEFELKMWQVQITVPGIVYSITCAVSEPDFEGMRPDFKRTLESFRPL